MRQTTGARICRISAGVLFRCANPRRSLREFAVREPAFSARSWSEQCIARSSTLLHFLQILGDENFFLLQVHQDAILELQDCTLVLCDILGCLRRCRMRRTRLPPATLPSRCFLGSCRGSRHEGDGDRRFVRIPHSWQAGPRLGDSQSVGRGMSWVFLECGSCSGPGLVSSSPCEPRHLLRTLGAVQHIATVSVSANSPNSPNSSNILCRGHVRWMFGRKRLGLSQIFWPTLLPVTSNGTKTQGTFDLVEGVPVVS